MDNGTRDKFEKGIIILHAIEHHSKNLLITPQPEEGVDIKLVVDGITTFIEAKGSDQSISSPYFVKAIVQITRTWNAVNNLYQIWITPKATFDNKKFISSKLSKPLISKLEAKIKIDYPDDWGVISSVFATKSLLIEFKYRSLPKNKILRELNKEAKQIGINLGFRGDKMEMVIEKMNYQIDNAHLVKNFSFSGDWFKLNYKFALMDDALNYSYKDFLSKSYSDVAITEEKFNTDYTFNIVAEELILNMGEGIPDSIQEYVREKIND